MKQAQTYLKTLQATSRTAGTSFPFELAERSDDVARSVFVKQSPPRLFASAGLPRRLGERRPLGDELAHFAGEVLEVATLVLDSASPIADDRAMTGNDAFRGDLPEHLEVGEKAANTAIEDRDMPDEQQIAGEQRRTGVVEDRQVVVGVPRLPGFQGQGPLAEIDLHFPLDEQRGRHNLHFV